MENNEKDTINPETDNTLDALEMLGKLLADSVIVGKGVDLEYLAIIDNPINRKILEKKVVELIDKL